MEPILHNVRDIADDERRYLERLLGHRLRDDQQLIIHVVNLDEASPDEPPAGCEPSACAETAAAREARPLPDWCDVYRGLSTREIEELEEVILTRANLTRVSE